MDPKKMLQEVIENLEEGDLYRMIEEEGVGNTFPIVDVDYVVDDLKDVLKAMENPFREKG